jgi:hypothetical protein
MTFDMEGVAFDHWTLDVNHVRIRTKSVRLLALSGRRRRWRIRGKGHGMELAGGPDLYPSSGYEKGG